MGTWEKAAVRDHPKPRQTPGDSGIGGQKYREDLHQCGPSRAMAQAIELRRPGQACIAPGVAGRGLRQLTRVAGASTQIHGWICARFQQAKNQHMYGATHAGSWPAATSWRRGQKRRTSPCAGRANLQIGQESPGRRGGAENRQVKCGSGNSRRPDPSGRGRRHPARHH